MTRLSSTLALFLIAGCGGGSGGLPDAASTPDARVETGTISLTWELTDTNAAPLSCEDIAALSVSVTATPQQGGFGVVDAFTCGTGSGTTRQLNAGTYRVIVGLGANVGSLAETMSIRDVVVTAGQDTSLGAITFEVNPQGSFKFSLDAPATAGNCDDEGANGGGITTLEIELHDGDDTCLLTTFAITDTADYANDCAGAVNACIENDKEISVTAVPSGPHTLVVRGFKGGMECYSRTAQLSIPGNDLERDMGVQALILAPIVGCDPNATNPDAGVSDAGVNDAGTTDAPP